MTIHPDGDNGIIDSKKLIAKHYDMSPGSFYLIRPDQHVAARWRLFDAEKVKKALAKAIAQH
jgi:3-(3-hydroxy-phenyl)propionate hydroxylase